MASSDDSQIQRTAAFDLGRARIGAALSDPMGWTAQGRGVHQTARDIPAQLVELLKDWGAQKVVLGLPRLPSGEEGEQAAWVRNIARVLEQEHAVEVVLWDERLTTVQAEADMARGGLDSKKRKKLKDQVAAQIILQSYLDSKAP